jgi:hypothetical protein
MILDALDEADPSEEQEVRLSRPRGAGIQEVHRCLPFTHARFTSVPTFHPDQLMLHRAMTMVDQGWHSHFHAAQGGKGAAAQTHAPACANRAFQLLVNQLRRLPPQARPYM